MSAAIHAYDVMIGLALVGSAWKALYGRDVFAATVFFIVYGLLMALAWGQLGALDVGLAEACIGAGLTGALLLGVIRVFEGNDPASSPRMPVGPRLVTGALSAMLTAVLIGALWRDHAEGRRGVVFPLVLERLSESGSTHPVTAVLLNFRAFDTWLELGVLWLAAFSAVVIRRAYDSPQAGPLFTPSSGQAIVIARALTPWLVLIAGLMLWIGARAPGGAFQAGAILGAAGVLLQLAGRSLRYPLSPWVFRVVLVLGFTTFILVGAGTGYFMGRLLEYPVSWASTCILALELAATFSIALTLNVMYSFGTASRGWWA